MLEDGFETAVGGDNVLYKWQPLKVVLEREWTECINCPVCLSRVPLTI
ncbi:hypothetical protein OROGR_011843 [Orobanche gracilis]